MTARRAARSPARPKETPSEAAHARRSRAMEEPLDVSWLQTEPYLIGLVRNPLHGTRYRVYAPDAAHLDDALCTCPDFARRGPARCKHLEAVRLWMDAHHAPPPVARGSTLDTARIWAAVDRGHAGRAVSLRQLRSEGRTLFQGRPTAPSG